jgi:CRP/FNR family transcriptional regulator, cyclic AMP receptor protein
MDTAQLEGLPLFADLSKQQRQRVAQLADEVDLGPDKELIHEGRFAYEFFAIEDGTAEVLRGGEHVADLGPGDFFGEMGAIKSATRNATVVTRSPMTLVVMSAQDFRHVAAEIPALAERIQSAIEARCHAMNAT